MAAIKIEDLTKRFGDVIALNNVSLTVEEGEIFGFLGPNGSGKSTTMDILLGLVLPTEGRAQVLGFDAENENLAIRRRTGVLPDAYHVYDRLTGREHVQFSIDSKEANDDSKALLTRVGIEDAAERPAGEYSRGMRQRLVLAMALAGAPDLLMLDEPTVGLDPNGAHEVRRIIREERKRGATVFFSSHLLEQIEAVCDRIAILHHGRIVAVGTIEELRDSMNGGKTLSITVDAVPKRAIEAIQAVKGVQSVVVKSNRVIVQTDGESKTSILHALEDCGADIHNFATGEASLEELFRHFTEDQEDVSPGGDSL